MRGNSIMEKTDNSLISLLAPKSNSTVMIYDVHASESGALAILNDLYNQIRAYEDKSVKWVFIVSTPEYEETDTIVVRRFPWVKKNWGYRYYFDSVTTRKLIKQYQPDQVFSLQNKGISFYHKRQLVYLHLPFILTDHRFKIKIDGKKLWLYQNVVSKSIFLSLRKVDMTIVQTNWMKEALIKKAGVNADRITIIQPDITSNAIGTFVDSPENRRRFFYPATAFTYKNHMTLLKAVKTAQDNGLRDYEVIFTIKDDENSYTHKLFEYAQKNNLNVQFGGSLRREKVFELYARSVLVFPSYVESFGLPLLEARMTGTPIIAADCPFSREILNGYDKAIYFSELDYIMLGKKIIELVK
jgi:glycosyltransferase involved in cell wall biosynthesis